MNNPDIQAAIQKAAKLQQILSSADHSSAFSAAMQCEAIAAQITTHLGKVIYGESNHG